MATIPEKSRETALADAVPNRAIERLRRGDPEAFRAVYDAHRARLYTFLLRLSGDEQVARDLSQEVWLRLARHAPRLNADTEPGAWLFVVARNLFRSYRRWHVLDRRRLSELLVAPRTEVPTPLERAALGETERRLERALARLPVRYREVVLLSGIEGFSAEQVGAMLELTPVAVRQRLSRGRSLLKAALADEPDCERRP